MFEQGSAIAGVLTGEGAKIIYGLRQVK